MARKRSRGSKELASSRQKASARYGFTVPDYDPFGDLTEVQYYKQLAKTADNRLEALEQHALKDEVGFKDMLNYAYANAMYEIRHIRGEEWSRFGQAIPKTKSGEVNKMELHRRIQAVKRFLESPTSTKRGIQAVYRQRAESLNKSLGLKGKDKLTWKDIANYYESRFEENSSKQYGSQTKFRALGAVRRISKDTSLVAEIKAGNKKNVKIAKDEIINRVAIEMIQNGLDPASIF